MTAGTAAIALTAPFTGALADVLGRKRLMTAAVFAVVVTTLIMTLAASVPQLVVWRFAQGLLLPPIFTVAALQRERCLPSSVIGPVLCTRCDGWPRSA